MKQFKQSTGLIAKALRLIVARTKSQIVKLTLAVTGFYADHFPVGNCNYLIAGRFYRIDAVRKEVGQNDLCRNGGKAVAERDFLSGRDFAHITIVVVNDACQLLPLRRTIFTFRVEQGRCSEPEYLPAVFHKSRQ